MTKLNSHNSQIQPNQNTHQHQISGFEFIIGSIRKAILIRGVRLIIIGIVLLIISMLFEFFGQHKQIFVEKEILSNNQKTIKRMEEVLTTRKRIFRGGSSFCLNVGVAFIASGSVLVTVELKSNEERQGKYETLIAKMDEKTNKILAAIEENTKKKIEDITIASQDTIISSLIQNEHIFDQVKSHILRQDFIIEKYLVKVSFDWFDENTILEKSSIKYYVHNISHKDKSYLINFYIYNDNLKSDLAPYVGKYCVNEKNFLVKDLINEMEIQRKQEEQYIGFDQSIKIESNSRAKIEIEFIAYRKSNDHEPFFATQITDTMTLQISNSPQNLNVFCIPLHPQENSHKKHRYGEELDNVWHINTGLFPFQGFYLCWQKNREIKINSASIL